MAAQTIQMLQIRRIIQLLQSNASVSSISRQCQISRPTVRVYREQIARSQLDYAALMLLDDLALSNLIHEPQVNGSDPRLVVFKNLLPDILKELSKTGVTKQLLWQEYRVNHPDGYGYSQFCSHLWQYEQQGEVVMHFTYTPGEKLMIDFAGKKITIRNSKGEEKTYEVFIATFPFSGFTYSEGINNQRQGNLLKVMEDALIYFGGVPRVIIPDNMKSSVTKPDRYEPELTVLMQQFCLHYNTSIMPARPRKPKDKPSVEKAVHLAYERIYAPLRNKTFESLEELNEAILEQLDAHHTRPFRRGDQNRQTLFTEQEKPALEPLPSSRMEIKKTVSAKVQRNYHVVLGQDWHFYSVPFEHVGKQVDIIYTEQTVEIYLKQSRIAIHKRVRTKNGYCTLHEHMPVNHQEYVRQKGWNPDYFRSEAKKISPETEQVISKVLESRQFYEQTYNACIGILRLSGKYTSERLTAACTLALQANAVTYRFISNVLKNNTDKRLQQKETPVSLFDQHENLRGPQAYQ